jgi:NADPH:quinone reductase-like Zn-dependent oxidoreductase
VTATGADTAELLVSTVSPARPSGSRAPHLFAELGLTREQLGRDDVTLAPIMANPVTATLAKLADAAAAGIIRVPVTRTYDLEDVPQGLADFAAGTLGKLAVRIDD